MNRSEDGSMLLEVLVAFVILAGAVLLGFRIFGDGLRGLHAAEERSRLIAVARRELALIELASELRGGRVAGQDDEGTRWSTDIMPLDDMQSDAAGAAIPFRVTITVERLPAKHPVVLETILIAPPQQ